jgi:hypothetical protein
MFINTYCFVAFVNSGFRMHSLYVSLMDCRISKCRTLVEFRIVEMRKLCRMGGFFYVKSIHLSIVVVSVDALVIIITKESMITLG